MQKRAVCRHRRLLEEISLKAGRYRCAFRRCAEPQAGDAYVWNYWHVPGTYAYLKTVPERVIAAIGSMRSSRRSVAGPQRVRPCHLAIPQHVRPGLLAGRAQRFGEWAPWLRLLDDLELRKDDRRRDDRVPGLATCSGPNLDRPAAGRAIFELVEASFNRLTLFDDRGPARRSAPWTARWIRWKAASSYTGISANPE